MSNSNANPIDPQNPTGYGNNVTPPDNSGIPNQIPVPTPSQTPTAAPAAPVASAPAGPQGALSQNPTQPTTQPSKTDIQHGIFRGVLQMLSGAPRFVLRTDPETGDTTRVPVQLTKGDLGKSILAGALAGMFGGMGARDPEGRRDPVLAASQGYQAGAQLHEKQQATAQAVEDQNVSRRQMTMKANLDVARQTLALNMNKQNMFAKIAENNKAGILKDALAYDKSLTDKSQPTAILKQGLTHDEALAALKGNWSTQLAQVDGYQTKENGDVVPTFTVLNPDVKVRMNEQQVKDFSRFNPQYQTAWDQTDGNVSLPLHAYADATNKLNSLEHMETYFQNEASELGLKPTFDFATMVRNGGPKVFNAVLEAENNLAGGGSPVDALQRLTTAPGGSVVLKEMGIDNAKVQQLIDERAAAKKRAEAGQKQETINDANRILADDSISKDDPRKTWANNYVGLVEKQKRDEQDSAQKIKDGSPEDAAQLLLSGAVAPSQIVSARNASFATKTYAIAAQQAAAQGKTWTAPTAEANYAQAKSPANLAFFGSAGSLVDQGGTLDQLIANMPPNGQIPALNAPINWLTHEVGGVAPTGFLATAIGVADDYAKVMGSGTGSDTARQQVLDSIVSSQNPQQMQKVADSMKAAVRSQIRSRIGNNPYLMSMYSNTLGNQTQASTPKAQAYTPVAGDRPIMKGGKTVGYLSADGTRHSL